MLKSFTREEKSWIMYDWANSAYSAIITVAVLPLLFKTLTRDAGIAGHLADSYWGYVTSLATLIVALLAPILGTIGDYRQLKMRMFKIFLAIGLIATAALAFTLDWTMLLILNLISIIGFSGANLYYDGFLVDVTTEDRMDRVSTYGFALGYLGGSTIPFIVAIILIMLGEKIGIPKIQALQWTFLLTALWWGLFSIPMLRNVKQRYAIEPEPNLIAGGFKRLLATFRNIKSYKSIFWFLLAYFFYIDGVNTIIHMATVFGDSLGIAGNTLIMVLLVVQIVAFPCAIIYGKLANRFGSFPMIIVGIMVYILICFLAYQIRSEIDFWILALLVATSQGGIQALSRSYFSKMIPKENANEFFGFYNIFGKFAAVMGPALFGIFNQITGQSRYGVLSIMILFIIGGGIMLSIPKQNRA